MENRTKHRKALLGIIILAIGTFLLLDNFNLLDFPVKQYIFSWKTLMIVIGVALLASRKNATGGIILVSLGTIFWIPEIFNHQVAINQIFLPAVMIVFGVIMLSKIRSLRGNKNHRVQEAEIVEMEADK